MPHRADIERVVVPAERIAARVGELAADIARCYAGQELTILAVLTGSLIFLADLIRRLPVKMRLDLVSVSSYPGDAIRSQGPRLLSPLAASIAGKHVLIVDDILDSGATLAALQDMIQAQGPVSLRTCVLLMKVRDGRDDRRAPDFVGFEVGREFIVGYGLDHDSFYRNLPDICVLRRHAGGADKETP